MYPSQLGPEQRRDALARMASETLDILVIGGGVTGAGAALDAATRGLAVGLVEARDYASGTSSRSSKLIHGGCATSSSATSRWSEKRCGSVHCYCRDWPRTSSVRCRSCSR
jgi:heterodisulfide reductase subunit A-like polyferredoxin